MINQIYEKAARMLGFKPLIKIDGVTDFDELNRRQVGLMIDSYFAEYDRDPNFAGLALSEFLDWKLTSEELLALQTDINERAFPAGATNEKYLLALKAELVDEPDGSSERSIETLLRDVHRKATIL